MASGDLLFDFAVQANEPPASAAAALDVRNARPVIAFDATTDESAVFCGTLPNAYAAGGITLTLEWTGASATSGNVVWQTAFERCDTGTDMDADSFATANSTTAAAPGTSGAPAYTTVAHTNGAQIDSVLKNETFRLKVTRNASSGSDTMTGDSHLSRVFGRES